MGETDEARQDAKSKGYREKANAWSCNHCYLGDDMDVGTFDLLYVKDHLKEMWVSFPYWASKMS
mgnify:CR=1 FL=1